MSSGTYPRWQKTGPAEWPDLLPGYDWRPAFWSTRRRDRRLPTPDLLPAPPRGILLHSGDLGRGTAQWAWRRDALYWAHWAWDAVRCCYVQTDSLHSWAPHGGTLNQWTWGIETPHHPGADDSYRDQTVRLVRDLRDQGAEWITCHRFVDHGKRDPGEVVTADWFAELGLRLYWGWQGEGGGAILEAEGIGSHQPRVGRNEW